MDYKSYKLLRPFIYIPKNTFTFATTRLTCHPASVSIRRNCFSEITSGYYAFFYIHYITSFHSSFPYIDFSTGKIYSPLISYKSLISGGISSFQIIELRQSKQVSPSIFVYILILEVLYFRHLLCKKVKIYYFSFLPFILP